MSKSRVIYHACRHCTAKFYSPKTLSECPRCGAPDPLTDHDAPRVPPPSKASNPDAAEPCEQERIEAAYREQQRRRSCPGCGEEPFLD